MGSGAIAKLWEVLLSTRWFPRGSLCPFSCLLKDEGLEGPPRTGQH